MKRRAIPRFWRFVFCLFISSVIGWLGTLLIAPATPIAESITHSIIKNPDYHPLTIYILLALIPLVISVLSGQMLAILMLPKGVGGTE